MGIREGVPSWSLRSQKGGRGWHLAIEVYGFGAGGGHFVKIIRDRHQIETRPVAGCAVDEGIVGHAAGYNAISQAEIDRRIGRAALDAAQEEGSKLDNEENALREQAEKEFTQRLTSLPPEGKVITEKIDLGADQPLSEDSFPEKEIAKFIHAIENYVVRAVSADAAAAEFRVHGDLSPTEAPNFETSATFSLTRPVYDRLRKDLEELPDVRPKRERVPYYLVFTIAGAAADPDDAANAWRQSGDSTAAAVAAHP